MKTLILKKEKWYHSNYLILENGEQVGLFNNETFKSGFSINLYNTSLTMRKGNFWKNEIFLYENNTLIGEISQQPFKSQSIVKFTDGSSLKVKMNIWKSKNTLYSGEKIIGELKSKTHQQIVTVHEEMPLPLINAFIITSMMEQQAYYVFIALIPVFIAAVS